MSTGFIFRRRANERRKGAAHHSCLFTHRVTNGLKTRGNISLPFSTRRVMLEELEARGPSWQVVRPLSRHPQWADWLLDTHSIF